MEGSDPYLNAAERSALDEIGRVMRTEGWADHVAVPSLLDDWRALSKSVGQYDLSIDDYTNDLCSRDGLALALSKADQPLRARLTTIIEQADREFTARTVHDNGAAVGRYFRLDPLSGWWWRRRPEAGPLADYLDGADKK